MNSTPVLRYTESQHAYYLDGTRCVGVSSAAKLAQNDYSIQQWVKRMVATGVAIDHNLRENIAVHLDNKEMMNRLADEALSAARARDAADRGTQMHHVMEMVLLGREDRLLTDQQRRDADTLKRTLDRHRLTPVPGLIEQFVVWPDYKIAGRFDAVLEKPDGTKILTDLKSSANAVRYPHSTSVQLSLYARAPHVSTQIDHRVSARSGSDECVMRQWSPMPTELDLDRAYVLLVEPDSSEGDVYSIDIEHGWHAAERIMAIIDWRRKLDKGKMIATYLPPDIPAVDPSILAGIRNAADIEALREIWRVAALTGELNDEVKQAIHTRRAQLVAA